MQDPNWATVRLPPTPHMAVVPRAEPLRLTRNLQAGENHGSYICRSGSSQFQQQASEDSTKIGHSDLLKL